MSLIIDVSHLFLITDEKEVAEVKDIASKLFPSVDFSKVNGFVPIYTRDKFNLYCNETYLGFIDCYEVTLAECEWIMDKEWTEPVAFSNDIRLNKVLYDLLEKYDCHR